MKIQTTIQINFEVEYYKSGNIPRATLKPCDGDELDGLGRTKKEMENQQIFPTLRSCIAQCRRENRNSRMTVDEREYTDWHLSEDFSDEYQWDRSFGDQAVEVQETFHDVEQFLRSLPYGNDQLTKVVK